MKYGCYNGRMKQSFFFYDLETSGLSARRDRIMQFAGQRTDLELNPIGKPINILVKMNDDTLPSPQAIMVTGILPQETVENGMSEAEFCRFLIDEVFIPGTIATGFNSVRFDDEFIRFLFWRNFYDAYEWQWKDGRGKWDLLDVVRMVRALRPEGINWPVDETGKATNRLELLTAANGISHEAAHDALSDVNALIAVTRLIREKQPKMYEYLFEMRDKNAVAKLVDLRAPKPFVYTSGKYPTAFEKTTVAIPIMAGRNGSVYVYDLRYNIEDLLTGKVVLGDKTPEEVASEPKILRRLWPAVKELKLNRCPAVAPLGVLEAQVADIDGDGNSEKNGNDWGRIGLTKEAVLANLAVLQRRKDVIELMETERDLPDRRDFGEMEAEGALYDAFLPREDVWAAGMVRGMSEERLADFVPEFKDERLPELFLRYKARNFAKSLSAEEEKSWQEYRKTRILSMEADFLNGMREITEVGGERGEKVGRALDEWYKEVTRGLY